MKRRPLHDNEEPMLTPEEERLVTMLANVYDAFVDIAPHPNSERGRNDLRRVHDAVSGLQEMVLSNAAARAFPDRYKPFGASQYEPGGAVSQ